MLLPKAELHVHIEATLSPELAQKLAARNGVTLDPKLFTPDGQNYTWDKGNSPQESLANFVGAYHAMAAAIKKPEDYFDIAYNYLIASAAEGGIYVEFMISSEMEQQGIPYLEMVEAIAAGCKEARAETGIEARLINTAIQNCGKEAAIVTAQKSADNPHPYVTGFGLAGDETLHKMGEFKQAFDIARKAGLGLTAHAGETTGAQTVRDAVEILKVSRVGHMVRAAEDPRLVDELVQKAIVPEVCVTSNMLLKVYPDYKSHPLRRFFDAGLPVVISTDDPAFFKTSIGREYEVAKKHFGFTDAELLQLTRNAVAASFAPDSLKKELLAKVDSFKTDKKKEPGVKAGL